MSFRNRFIAAVLAVGALACATKDKATDSTSVAPAGAPKDPTPAVVTVHAKDFAFDAPAEITAGMTTLKLINDGPNFHHLLLVRLDSGKTMADLEAALKKKGPPPAWMVNSGGPSAADPSGEASATVNLTEGQYALICMIDMPGGVPHFAKGMVKALTVKPAAGPSAPAPVADVKLVLNDYNFDFSTPITAGSHTIEVRNAAKQPHEVVILKLAPGKTVKDFNAWMAKMDGPPPGSAIGGTLPTSGGTPAYFTADFTPADYVFICFIPDAKDGKPHVQHGMITTVTVK